MTELQAHVEAIERGERPITVAVTDDEFLAKMPNGKLVCRDMFVKNYRHGQGLAETTAGALRFSCNQIATKEVNRVKAQELSTYESQWPLEFVVYMFGSVEDGRALVLRVRGFWPFTDVALERGETFEHFESAFQSEVVVRNRMLRDRVLPYRMEVIAAHTPDSGGLSIVESAERPIVVRISSPASSVIVDVNRSLKDAGRRLYNNTLKWYPTLYYRHFLAETGLTLGSWLEASSWKPYVYLDSPTGYGGSILYAEANWHDLSISSRPLLFRDPALTIAWDVETFGVGHNNVPLHSNPADELSLICCKFYWDHSTKPVFSVAISRRPCDAEAYQRKYPNDPCVIVHCATQSRVLMLYSMLFKRCHPSFVRDFNGSGYDWPWLVNRADRVGLVALTKGADAKQGHFLEIFYKNMCYSECGRMLEGQTKYTSDAALIMAAYTNQFEVKIAAGKDLKCYPLWTDGYVCTDIMISCMKKYAGAEITTASSLSYFAAIILGNKNKMDLDADSPDAGIRARKDHYAELRRIFVEYDSGVAYSPDHVFNERMPDLLHYCFEDAEICQLIAHKQGMTAESRSWANEARLSLSDIIWQANGIRVVNALAYNGRTRFAAAHGGARMIYNFAKPVADPSEPIEKIGGAYVVTPLYGLELFSPVFAVDINSLYPSIMIYFNLCHSHMILHLHQIGGRWKPDYARMWQDVLRVGIDNVHEISFNYAGETYVFFTLKHRGDQAKMGNIPLLLKSIFDRRIVKKEGASRFKDFCQDLDAVVSTKKPLGAEEVELRIAKWEQICAGTYVSPLDGSSITIKSQETRNVIGEYVAKFLHSASGTPGDARTAALRAAVAAELDYLWFLAKLTSADEQAMKLLMNTTYGVMAARINILFHLYLSSAVTVMGQRIIKMLQAEARRVGYILVYGDTDSMYLKRDMSFWQAAYDRMVEAEDQIRGAIEDGVDASVVLERLRVVRRAYYAEVIPAAIKDAKNFVKLLNAFLKAAHDGQDTISIAFEEVICPAMFFSKKVYAGAMHKNEAVLDFRFDEVFSLSEKLSKDAYEAAMKRFLELALVKGLDMIKQGFAQMTVDATIRMLSKIIDPLSDSNLQLVQPTRVVEGEIAHLINDEDWTDYERFVITKTFKRHKQNVPVQEFVAKLRARGDPREPADGEKFLFVMRELQGASHNIYGRKNEVRTSQMMELFEEARDRGLPLNKRYYITRQMKNTLCKLSSYLFDTAELDPDGAMDEKQRAAALTKAAEKYVSEIIGTYLNETKEVHHDVRRFLREVGDNVAPQVGRVVSSLYSVIDRGHFKVREDAPIVLSKRPVCEIPAAMIVGGYEPWQTLTIAAEGELQPIADRLEPIMRDVRAGYEHIENRIETWRRAGNAANQIVFESADITIITQYLNILDDAIAMNLQNARRVAAQSRELLLL